MSQVPSASPATGSTSAAEKSASTNPPNKTRSCVICRSRKVRCDKLSPCSNCRKAGIPCVLPSTDRPPRWARRLVNNQPAAATAQMPQDVTKAMERLQNLEKLVKDLSGQLEQAHAAQRKSNSPAASTNSTTTASSVHQDLGRLVLQDTNQNRYVTSGFWSKVNDELTGLSIATGYLEGDESDSSSEEPSFGTTPSTRELERKPSDRHAFLFRHNISPNSLDLREFHPLPSQVPFLLDVFNENVNYMAQMVHMPSIMTMARNMRGNSGARLTPSNEALMFALYYAAVTSMEDDDVMANFGSSKSDLNLKYRLGLEHALAQADFLENPNITLVQAFVIFLFLARRHDSPRWIWMMTGLVIRMAQYLGLQRDGADFKHLSPFEIELQRKMWYGCCLLDTRASEDQGTELLITYGSFNTKIPLNINIEDLSPNTKEMPAEREGLTDMTIVRVYFGIDETLRRMIAKGVLDSSTNLENKTAMLNELYQQYEQGYLNLSSDSLAYWVSFTIARIVMSKMTLIVFLPVLFASPNEQITEALRTKLLMSAIEVAEYNHAINAEKATQPWKWICQTYTHWHAIVYLLLDISRREWSPTVERAWVALHSKWLIPETKTASKVWIPLRKLMTKARKYRDAEIKRLRTDMQAAAILEVEDRKMPLPTSSGPFPKGNVVELFRERWRQLVGLSEAEQTAGNTPFTSGFVGLGHDEASSSPVNFTPDMNIFSSAMFPDPVNQPNNPQSAFSPFEATSTHDNFVSTNTQSPFQTLSNSEPKYNQFSALPTDMITGPNLVPWLWSDSDLTLEMNVGMDMDHFDFNPDLDSGMDWYNWVESAKNL